MRQSEVVPPTRAAFDHLRHLTRADVVMEGRSLTINIKVAKNLQRYDQSRQVTVYMAENQDLCLIRTINIAILRCGLTNPCLCLEEPQTPYQRHMCALNGAPQSSLLERSRNSIPYMASGRPRSLPRLTKEKETDKCNISGGGPARHTNYTSIKKRTNRWLTS